MKIHLKGQFFKLKKILKQIETYVKNKLQKKNKYIFETNN